MPVTQLLSLPEDLLLQILLYVSIPDLLSLQKTCRHLHTLGSSEYVWHRSLPSFPLPLNVSLNTNSINLLSTAYLKQQVVRALRFRQNWCKPETKIKLLTTARKDGEGRYFEAMQLLPGSEWLVTAEKKQYREQFTCRISIWCLQNITDTYTTMQFEVSGRFKSFSASPDPDGAHITLALSLTSHSKEHLRIYHIRPEDPADMFSERPFAPKPQLRADLCRPGAHGIIHEVDAHHGVVAATLVDFLGPTRSFKVLLFKVSSMARATLEPKFQEPLVRLSVRLYDRHIALIGICPGFAIVRVYELPTNMLEKGMSPKPPHITTFDITNDKVGLFGRPVVEHRTLPLGTPYDFFICEGAHHRLGESVHISAIAFRSFYDDHPASAFLYTFELDLSTPSSGGVMTTTSRAFLTRGATSVEHVLAGLAQRAVWMEHHWEIDEVRLMKLGSSSMKGGKLTASVLLPSAPNLPFTPRFVQTMAFDEIAGRLCLGLHTGALYILDF